MAKVKVSMTLDQAIVDRVKEYAKDNGIPFSGAVSVLCNQALTSQRVVSQNAEALDIYKRLALALEEDVGDQQ